jgi:hypothetical protein
MGNGKKQDVLISSARFPSTGRIIEGVHAGLICTVEQMVRCTAHADRSLSVQGTHISGSARKA